MNVLINALGVDMGGALRHLTSFLPALEAVGTGHRYTLVVRQSVASLLEPGEISICAIPNRVAERWSSRLVQELIRIPLLARRIGADVIVSLTNFGPIWTTVPHILFQRNALFFSPEVWGGFSSSRRRRMAFQRRLLEAMMKKADLIVTPSQSMADLIRRSVPSLSSRPFEVLHHAVSGSKGTVQVSPARQASFSRATGLKLFYPSHAAPYKGFVELFRLLGVLAGRRDFTLFTPVGEGDDPIELEKYRKAAAEAGISDRVAFLGRVSQVDMEGLYGEVDAVVFPSLCESFGFPLVEALAAGLPIAANDSPVTRELCADAAIYFDVRKFRLGAEVLERLWDPELRKHLSDAARLRSTGFPGNWEQYANRFGQLIERVISR